MFSVFNDLLARWPALQGIYFYAIAIPIIVVGFVFLRFVLGRMMKRRSDALQDGSAMMMTFEQMWKKGLISEEEYKAARRKAAEKQLSAINEEARSRETMNLLKAVELNPELARELIKPTAPAPPRPAAPAPLPAPQPPQPTFRIISEEVVSEHPTGPLPADFGLPRPPKPRPAPAAPVHDDFIPGDPLSDPRMNQARAFDGGDPLPPLPPLSPPAPPPAAAPAAGSEIAALYQKGLISREEYERLTALTRESGR